MNGGGPKTAVNQAVSSVPARREQRKKIFKSSGSSAVVRGFCALALPVARLASIASQSAIPMPSMRASGRIAWPWLSRLSNGCHRTVATGRSFNRSARRLDDPIRWAVRLIVLQPTTHVCPKSDDSCRSIQNTEYICLKVHQIPRDALA